MSIVHGKVFLYNPYGFIGIKQDKKIKFYKIPKRFNEELYMYFRKDTYVIMKVGKTVHNNGKITYQHINSFMKVKTNSSKRKPIVYYSIDDVKTGIKKLILDTENKMFLDFEMNMNPFKKTSGPFTHEIIQAGLIVVDKNNNILYKYSSYIRTKKHELTDRSVKKLKVTNDMLNNGVSFPQFYKVYCDIIKKYNPKIFVWGKNDIIALQKSYKIHNIKKQHIIGRDRYINLLQLHKTYFSLKNDLGLFKAYSTYYNVDDINQKHDALEDAIVTKDIYVMFEHVCENDLNVKFNH